MFLELNHTHGDENASVASAERRPWNGRTYLFFEIYDENILKRLQMFATKGILFYLQLGPPR
jgi:hypothetical protein